MAEKILIVDDDIDTLRLIGLMLQRQGYDIAAANSGQIGLDKAAEEGPDLILLDVMMPDMDGYEFTRRMRGNPDLAHIPILMFTAKTMVDDKVAGFEAGADDYLTKPAHPAELTSRVRALLQRAVAARATGPLPERGRLVGFLGAKGGLGTTTLALNVGVALALTGEKTIVADLRPGQGMMGLLLGLDQASGMEALLEKKTVGEITSRTVESHLVTHDSGLRLLLSSARPAEASLGGAAAQAEQIVRQLSGLCKFLVLDLGAGLSELTRRIATTCDALVVTVEPQRLTLAMATNLIADLAAAGVNPAQVDIVLLNRVRSSVETSWQAAQSLIHHPIGAIVSPAPELAYQAAENSVPMILLQPQSTTAEQIRNLAQHLAQKVQAAGAPPADAERSA